jgi:hypothetical protein
MLRREMGLAAPHLEGYTQFLNSRFTMRGLRQPTRAQTRYDGGQRESKIATMSRCRMIGRQHAGFLRSEMPR